ncbi:MAG: DNA repair protein RecO [Flavobacteriales bacterium]|nr:DNA repair protein RecO [Flavobacteriales bacterium]
MLVNSRGIVLSTLRYSDSSVIARILTEHAGQKAFMVRVGKGRGAVGKMGLLQPLSLVNVSFDHDDRLGLRTPRSLERDEALHNIPFDTIKASIAIFMAEVLSRSLQDETADMKLFSFLRNSILQLDSEVRPCHNFHLAFLLQLSSFLGCAPDMNEAGPLPYFDLREGLACNAPPLHPDYLSGSVKSAMVQMESAGMDGHASVHVSNEDRRTLLRAMVDYYRFHLDGMREIRSHLVLEEVMA